MPNFPASLSPSFFQSRFTRTFSSIHIRESSRISSSASPLKYYHRMGFDPDKVLKDVDLSKKVILITGATCVDANTS